MTTKITDSGLALAFAAAALLLVGSPGTVAADHERGFLGVHIEEETDSPDGGARVEHVVPGSPADDAGLREGDVIQGVGGRVVRGPHGLGERLEEQRPGDRVTLDVLRDGARREIEVELGDSAALFGHGPGRSAEEWSEWGRSLGERMQGLGERLGERFGDSWRWERRFHPFYTNARPRLGVQLVEPTPELREHLGGDPDSGVLVSKVLADMPAEDGGVRVGDLIVAVDGEAIEDTSDLVRALDDRAGTTFEIRVIRDRRPISLSVALPELPGGDGPRARWRAPAPPPAPAAPRRGLLAPPPAVPAAPAPHLAPAPPPPPAPAARLRAV